MTKLKVLDLFAGTRSIARAFEARGHETFSIEFDEQHPDIDWYADMFDVTAEDIIERFGKPDVVWASPPCTRFSVAAIGKNWIKGTNEPKTPETVEALKLLEHTVQLIKDLDPQFYFIENPRGKMRKMDVMQDLPRHTVSYCLAGETEVITRDGYFSISDLVGKEVDLLSGEGTWVKAPIKEYGKQKLMEITLSRAGKVKKVFATPDHKWISRGKNVQTADLRIGQRLDYIKLESQKYEINSEFVARGFAYGDGWILKKEKEKKGFVMFVGEKQEMMKYFDGLTGKAWDGDKNGLSIRYLYGYPREWKTSYPSLHENPSKLASWLAGYIAADGTVHKKNGQVTIASSKREDLEYVRELCSVIGLDTYSIVTYMRKGYGSEETPLYQLSFMRGFIPRDLILRSKHLDSFDRVGAVKHQPLRWTVKNVKETNRYETVYCAEMPRVHTFALTDGLLTHNCQYGDFRMKPTDIWTNHPEPNFKPACKNGEPCHVAAPRGSQTGTQGIKGAVDRSRIPDKLTNYIVDITTDYKLIDINEEQEQIVEEVQTLNDLKYFINDVFEGEEDSELFTMTFPEVQERLGGIGYAAQEN